MRTVVVICGGWSVSQYDVKDLRSRGHVVGVNESSVLVQCHVGITMDRLWAENRFRQYFTTRDGDLWVRRGADKKLPQHPRLRQFECDHTSAVMSKEPDRFNGMNSGMVALNYALQLKPEQVFIFGLDMQKGPNKEPYWHPPYDWPEARPDGNTTSGKYKAWAPHFGVVTEQFDDEGIALYSVNHRSKAEGLRQISYGMFLEMTK
jgi:hypothetical protein